MSLSDVMVMNLEYFLALSDELQWEALANDRYFSELDLEVQMVYEIIRDKYTGQMIDTAQLLSHIRAMYDSQIGCRVTSYSKGKGKLEISYKNEFAGTIYFEVEK